MSVPSVRFPILLAHSGYARNWRIRLGHPLTEDRYIFPLRAGQIVVINVTFCEMPTILHGYEARIKDVLEHEIEIERAVRLNGRMRWLDIVDGGLAPRYLYRPPMLVLADSENPLFIPRAYVPTDPPAGRVILPEDRRFGD